MPIAKRKKVYNEYVKMERKNIHEVYRFIGDVGRMYMIEPGRYKIVIQTHERPSVFLKEGDYIMKNGYDDIYAIDENDFHDIYEDVTCNAFPR